MPFINKPILGWCINGTPTEDGIPANSTITNVIFDRLCTVTALTPLNSTNIDDPTRFDAVVNTSINETLINSVYSFIAARYSEYLAADYGLVYITDVKTNITNYSSSGGGTMVTTSVYQTATIHLYKNNNIPATSPSGV
jgi:hypothetical protein